MLLVFRSQRSRSWQRARGSASSPEPLAFYSMSASRHWRMCLRNRQGLRSAARAVSAPEQATVLLVSGPLLASATRRPACIPSGCAEGTEGPDRSAHRGRAQRWLAGRGRQPELARGKRDGVAVPDGAAKGEGVGRGMAQDRLIEGTGERGGRTGARRDAGFLPPLACRNSVVAVAGKATAGATYRLGRE